jgi:hypothetical protein
MTFTGHRGRRDDCGGHDRLRWVDEDEYGEMLIGYRTTIVPPTAGGRKLTKLPDSHRSHRSSGSSRF